MSNTSQRNKEFVKCCARRALELQALGQPYDLSRLVRDVLGGPAPAYYVDYYRATKAMRRAVAEGAPTGGKYRCTAMWADMYRDFLELQARQPRRTFYELVLMLCVGVSGHPRFYITHRSGMQLLRKAFVTTLKPLDNGN